MQLYDLKERYQKDIFTEELKEGFERTYVENYVRFATKLSKIPTPEAFFSEFPELLGCLDENDTEGSAMKIWDMFQRHKKSVNNVIKEKIKENVSELICGNIPDNSLIKIVTTGKHLLDLKIEYINKLKAILQDSIPVAFNSQKAKNETQAQDVGQAVLAASKERLDRESPQIPFATVTTKPDFSKNINYGKSLFLEFKHIKERRRLNSIITEMTSRVTIYRKQGACVLFVVHDPNRTIIEDSKFIDTFESYEDIFIALVR
jgi:hypothetical protein